MIAADGSVVWFWERAAIVRDAAGRPAHTQGVMIDITDRKLAEARLEEAEAELRRLAFHDPLTGLPNRSQLDVAAARRGRPRAPARPRGGAAVHRPRQLQARQRLARARGRRPAAAPGRRRGSAAPRSRAACWRATAATSSCVLLDDLEPGAAEAAAARRGGRRRGAPRQAVPDRGRRVPRGGERRHLAVPGRRRRRARAAPARRRRDVPEQGPRPRGLDGLRADDPRPARAALAVRAAAPRDRRRRARAALPADRVDGERPAALDGGAAALERPRARARAPGPLHPGRRGDEPARPDRRVGGRRDGPPAARVGGDGPAAADVVQRLPARAAPAGLRARAARAAARARASTRRC